jgi:hypothetical protein
MSLELVRLGNKNSLKKEYRDRSQCPLLIIEEGIW